MATNNEILCLIYSCP